MLPSEINIPINAKIYSPNEMSLTPLSFTEVCKIIESSSIPDIINKEDTLIISGILLLSIILQTSA